MKKVVSLILVFAVALSLISCGGNETEQKTTGINTDNNQANASGGENLAPQYGGTLRVVNTCEGSSELGVPWQIFNADTNCILPCFESLVYQTNTGELEPCLATSWESNVDSCSVIFHLREGVKFHDGSDFNAEAAAWNINQMIESGRHNGERCEVVDDYTIEIFYEEWSNTAATSMYSSSFSFMSMEQALDKGMEYAAQHPCGTGPFKYGEYVRGQSVSWVKNENYWQEGKPYLDSIEYVFMTDATTKANALKMPFEDGGIDILNVSDAYQISQLSQLDTVYVNYVDIGPVVLFPDSDDPDSPLSDVNVRKAISYAIDRDALCAARGYGVYTPATQLVSPAWECYLDDPQYDCVYDKQKALDLLEEAGYADGFETTIYVQPNMCDRDIMVAVQDMLSQVGITVKLEFPESGGYTDMKMNGWSGMLGQMFRNMSDIITTFVLFFDATYDEETDTYGHDWMPSAYRPEEVLYELEKTATSTVEMEDENLEAINEVLMGEMLAIPIYYCYDAFIIKNEVHDSGYGLYGMAFKPADAWKAQ